MAYSQLDLTSNEMNLIIHFPYYANKDHTHTTI